MVEFQPKNKGFLVKFQPKNKKFLVEFQPKNGKILVKGKLYPYLEGKVVLFLSL